MTDLGDILVFSDSDEQSDDGCAITAQNGRVAKEISLPERCYVCKERLSRERPPCQLGCECIVALCICCGIVQLQNTPGTYRSYLSCPECQEATDMHWLLSDKYCKLVSQYEDDLLKRACDYYRLPTRNIPTEKLVSMYQLYVDSGHVSEDIQSYPWHFEDRNVMRGLVARLEALTRGHLAAYIELLTIQNPLLSSFFLPLGPWIVLLRHISRNSFLLSALDVFAGLSAGDTDSALELCNELRHCNVCYELLRPNKTVHTTCSCVYMLCSDCAKQTIERAPETFCAGLQCPICKQFSNCILEVETARSAETKLVASAKQFMAMQKGIKKLVPKISQSQDSFVSIIPLVIDAYFYDHNVWLSNYDEADPRILTYRQYRLLFTQFEAARTHQLSPIDYLEMAPHPFVNRFLAICSKMLKLNNGEENNTDTQRSLHCNDKNSKNDDDLAAELAEIARQQRLKMQQLAQRLKNKQNLHSNHHDDNNDIVQVDDTHTAPVTVHGDNERHISWEEKERLLSLPEAKEDDDFEAENNMIGDEFGSNRSEMLSTETAAAVSNSREEQSKPAHVNSNEEEEDELSAALKRLALRVQAARHASATAAASAAASIAGLVQGINRHLHLKKNENNETETAKEKELIGAYELVIFPPDRDFDQSETARQLAGHCVAVKLTLSPEDSERFEVSEEVQKAETEDEKARLLSGIVNLVTDKRTVSTIRTSIVSQLQLRIPSFVRFLLYISGPTETPSNVNSQVTTSQKDSEAINTAKSNNDSKNREKLMVLKAQDSLHDLCVKHLRGGLWKGAVLHIRPVNTARHSGDTRVVVSDGDIPWQRLVRYQRFHKRKQLQNELLLKQHLRRTTSLAPPCTSSRNTQLQQTYSRSSNIQEIDRKFLSTNNNSNNSINNSNNDKEKIVFFSHSSDDDSDDDTDDSDNGDKRQKQRGNVTAFNACDATQLRHAISMREREQQQQDKRDTTHHSVPHRPHNRHFSETGHRKRPRSPELDRNFYDHSHKHKKPANSTGFQSFYRDNGSYNNHNNHNNRTNSNNVNTNNHFNSKFNRNSQDNNNTYRRK